MKKLAFVLAIVAVSFSSCKKTYTCTCTRTTVVGGSTITTPTITEIPDATQSQAQTICIQGEVYSQNSTKTTTCKL